MPRGGLGRQTEQHRADNHTGMVSCDVGELQPSGDIANRIDLFIGCPQAVIHGNSCPRCLDPCLIQIQTVCIGTPTDRDKDMRAFEHTAILGLHFYRALFAPHFLGVRPFGNLKPFFAQTVENDLGHFGVILAQRLGPFDHRHFGSQAQMRLRHFHPDGTAADHQQMLGLFTQLPQRFIGDVGHFVQTRDRRHEGR